MRGRYLKRRLINSLSQIFSVLMAFLGLMSLFWIIATLFVKGFPGLQLSTFTEITQPAGEVGGLLNALIGSLILVFVAILLGSPIGIMAGIYITEYGHNKRSARIIRFINDILLSVPTIIVGLFIYQIYVVPTQHFSGWAGTFALTIIVIPIVIRVTENMLLTVPDNLREASAALGAPEWKTIVFVLLSVARTGVITGILLALARIAGETAPLLFTALNNNFFSASLNKPMANLPSVIFQYALSPYDDWHQLAWTGALIITIWVLLINIIVRIISRQKIPLIY